MKKTTCVNRGIVCDSCQENVNVHGCATCGKEFYSGENIYCEHHCHIDCEHYHEECTKKEGE